MSISKLKSSTIKTGLEKGVKLGGDFLFARNSGTLTTSGLITHLDASDTSYFNNHNMLAYSEEFNNAYWTKQGTTVTANQTLAPDGTNTADLLIEDTSTGSHRIVRDSFSYTAGEYYTISVYAKANTGSRIAIGIGGLTGIGVLGANRTAYIDLSNGTFTQIPGGTTAASIEPVGNGWYRCSMTVQALASLTDYWIIYVMQDGTTNTLSYTGTGKSVYIWGAQQEQSQDLGPYLKTTANSIPKNTWRDLSGNNNNFTFGYNPINNYGFVEFDGSTDRASIPYGSSVFRRTDAITYEAFVKMPSDGGFNAGVSVNGGQGTGGINVTATQATSYFTPSNPTSDRSVTATYTSIANKWTQICWAVNYSAQTYQWYINGVAVTSTPSGSWTTMTPSGSYSAALDDLIGARHINTRYHTKCDLSIFRVYSKQLNSTEVLNNYNYSKARFGL
jgi:hypothetical protein